QDVHELLGRGVPVPRVGPARHDVHEPEALVASRGDLVVAEPLQRAPVVEQRIDLLRLGDGEVQHRLLLAALGPPNVLPLSNRNETPGTESEGSCEVSRKTLERPVGIVGMTPAATVLFGDFRIDLADERLWRGPEALPLSPKAFA